MKICILGAGAYGLCLGLNCLENNNNVTIWTKFDYERDSLILNRKSNSLPGVVIDSRIDISTDLELSIKDSTLIVVAVPACNVREVINEAKDYIKINQHICIASKGIEENTCKFMYDVVTDVTNSSNVAVLSGPGFAIDIANKAPTGLSIASKNNDTVKVVKETFENDHMKLYETSDIVGVQICGSIKNVLAIASGILTGLDYPISTHALFLTNSIKDIKNLIVKLGGSEDTITSLAGIGDIFLTCSSSKSRNYTLGKMIGSKCIKEDINSYINNNNVEGLNTLKAIFCLLKKEEINIPLINKLVKIIYLNDSVDDFVLYL